MNALQQQRLHHAYLFTGTRGIGKTTIGHLIAHADRRQISLVDAARALGALHRPVAETEEG